MSHISSLAKIATVVIAVVVSFGSPRWAAAQDFTVLIFSKTTAFRHGSIADGITAIQALGAANNFDVDTTEDAAQFNDANLSQYAAVIWLSTTGDVLNGTQQGAFERFIQAGGGWVGVHSATDTEYSWPWYGDLIGNDAWFNGHPAIQTATLERENASHISSAHYPASFSFTDEWYNFQNNPRVDASVLLTIDEGTYNGGSMGADHPISWYHEFDGGRSWYTAMGHRSETFADANFRQHLLGGILWAGGQDDPCNDGNPCTDDIEQAGGGCLHPANSAPCDDGDACTTLDTCSGGTCNGGPAPSCDDANVCTADSCNPSAGCQHTVVVSCPPGQACSASTGACEESVACIAAADASAAFNGAMTTGTQFTGGADLDPIRNNLTSPLVYAASTANSSNANNGDQVSYLLDIPTTGPHWLWARLYYPSTPGENGANSFFAVIDSGSAATLGNNKDYHQKWHWDGDGSIQNGAVAGLPLGSLAPGTHTVTVVKREVLPTGQQPRLDALCVTGDGVTPPADIDVLELLGIAQGCDTDAECDDANPCTDDSCSSGSVCLHVANSTPCDDLDACTTNDQCSAGACVGGPAPNCNDGNPCTTDSCSPGSGCMNTPSSGSCSDGNACTLGDFCSDGSCTAGAPRDCNDGNACTDDACNIASGCVHTNDDTNSCSNGVAADDPDTCEAGVCIGSTGCQGDDAACDDSNPCTTDVCLASNQCSHSNNAQSCDDENACTTNDICNQGLCGGEAELGCDDGNPCTDDSCDPLSGCAFSANAAPCDDGNACTTLDSCSAGSCAGGAAENCDDGNPCTDISCDQALGCLATPNAAACDDGDACTIADTCSGGSCAGGALACEQASGSGASVTTDSEQDGATASDILETTVVSPQPGTVTIAETQLPILEILVSAAATSASDPMRVLFWIDASLGISSSAQLTFDSSIVAPCADAVTADPDPCVARRADIASGDIEIEALSTSGGTWAITAAPSACGAEPAPACLPAGKAQFLIKDRPDNRRDVLVWKWKKGAALAMSNLGDPNRTTTYTLCVYDRAAGSATLGTALTLTPNPNWGFKGSNGWKYRDRDRARSGVQKALFTTGADGRTKASMKARGETLPLPEAAGADGFFVQDPAVTVQVVNTDGTCWTTEFAAATKNSIELFKAKSP